MPRPYIVILFIVVFTTLLGMSTLAITSFITMSFNDYLISDFIVITSVIFPACILFILLTIVGQHYYNSLTRWTYYISAIWIGLFCYLLIASAIGSVIDLALVPSMFISKLIGYTVILSSVIITITGVLRARRISVHEVTVRLPHLPQKWHGRSAVWVSDLHLGQIYTAGHTQKVVNAIKRVNPDIVFVGGDVFDGTTATDLYSLVDPFNQLNPTLGVYYITGNHEEFGGSMTHFVDAVKNVGMRVLMDQAIEIEGVQLLGVDYSHASDPARFKSILESFSIQTTTPSILLKHEPKHLAIAHEAGVSLQISGHTHRAQMWPLGYIAHWAYGGYSYGLKHYGTMQVLISSGAGTWGPPLRVGTQSEVLVIHFS